MLDAAEVSDANLEGAQSLVQAQLNAGTKLPEGLKRAETPRRSRSICSGLEGPHSGIHQTQDVACGPKPPHGLCRPTIFRAGRSPVGGGNGGHVEMAECLIFTGLLEIISKPTR
jgi:hypothetical protein